MTGDMAAEQYIQSCNAYLEVPLRAGTKDVRLLDLLPGDREHQLEVTLRAVPTEPTTPYYEALSYTWGSSSEDKTLLINGEHRVSITNNLFRALRAMRKKRGSRTMWVCIHGCEHIPIHLKNGQRR